MTTPGKGRIFISYRRADSAGYAGRIYDRLTAHFGEDTVFMDVDTIEAGLDFVEVLQNAVQSCDVLVALIGRSWLNIKDEAGKRRLDSPEDFVRVEIAAALSRDIRVIPVLVDGAPMPRSTELPANLKPLARRNALQVDHHSFNADAYRLIAQLELALKAAEDSRILKARRLQEDQERKEKEAREAEDRKRVESREQEERARLAAAKQAKKEREERERKEAVEKARKEKEERGRKAEPATPASQATSLTYEPQKEPVDRASSPTGVKTGKPAWLPYGIGGGVLVAIVILFGIGSLIYKTLAPASPTATERLQTEAPATQVSPAPVTSAPTSTAEPQGTPASTPGELGIGSTLVSEKDGMLMVYVPAGEFQMGSENGDSDERPVHTVYLDAFWIDRTEVTNEMFTVFLNEEGNRNEGGVTWLDAEDEDVRIFKEGFTWHADSGYAEHPVIEVSWYGAKAYCEWAGRQLPTEAEWEKAARGSLEGKAYPWGDQAPVCEKGTENGAQSYSCGGQTVPVGSFGQNGYGLYDMAGNVWEWVSSLYQSYPYEATDGRENLSTSGARVLRGGAWYSSDVSVRSSYRVGLDPSNPYYFGFRCSRSP